MKMTVSRYTTYSLCPQLYKFRYIEDIEEPTNRQLFLGSEVHDFAEDMWKDIKFKDGEMDISQLNYPDPEQPSLMNDEEFKDVKKDIKKQSKNLVKLFKERYELMKEKTDSPEKYTRPKIIEGKFKCGSFNYSGRVDLVLKDPDGSYSIFDYKSGGQDKIKTRNRLQLAMYYYLIRVNDRLENITTWGVIDTSSGTVYEEEVKMKWVKERLHDKMREVERKIENHMFDCPKGVSCRWCEDALSVKKRRSWFIVQDK